MLSACANKPRHVNADLPLVTEQSSELEMMNHVPEKYWIEFNKPGVVLMYHPAYEIVLKPIYVSALGLLCREVYIDSISHVACSVKPSGNSDIRKWYWVNGLVKDKLEKKL